MPKYFLEISYFGKHYCGWQVQPNAPSVQDVLNHRVRTLLADEQLYLVGSGRTDAGVHCRQQFAHFETQKPVETANFCHKLNAFLPKDISVRSLRKVIPSAHARFDALYRRYAYRLCFQKNPFETDFACQIFQEPDCESMNRAAQILTQMTHFESFCKTRTQNSHYRCQVTQAVWTKNTDGIIVFHIKANRFLRGMVRLIVGELLKVGTGKKSVAAFCEDAHSRSFHKARTAAPPEGLFLCEVGYPKHIFLDDTA